VATHRPHRCDGRRPTRRPALTPSPPSPRRFPEAAALAKASEAAAAGGESAMRRARAHRAPVSRRPRRGRSPDSIVLRQALRRQGRAAPPPSSAHPRPSSATSHRRRQQIGQNQAVERAWTRGAAMGLGPGGAQTVAGPASALVTTKARGTMRAPATVTGASITRAHQVLTEPALLGNLGLKL